MKSNIPLPEPFLERLVKILTPQNYELYLESLIHEKVTSFRVNTLKISTDAVLTELASFGVLAKPISWCKEGFYIDSSDRRLLTETRLVNEGLIYIQNQSSLFASLILNPQSGEEILDLAAAPGGKTLHMAALMCNQGRIAAVEVVKDRFFRLKTNIKRAGAEIIQTYNKDGSAIGRLVPERFDRVLLDAPCSSEGRFDIKEPSTFAYWHEKKILEMQRKQKKLIHSAIQSLKPLGTLVYCTCSFAPEENESIVQYAMKKFSGKLEILPIEVPFENYQQGLTHWDKEHYNENIKNAIRIIPSDKMNGFFICKLRKGTH